MTTSDIERVLKTFGYKQFKGKTANRIAIVTDEDRASVLQKVAGIFASENGQYIPDYTTPSGARISSAGVVLVGKGATQRIVYVKPASKQGKKSAGLGNESNFINGINKYLDEAGLDAFYTINIKFVAPGKTVEVNNVVIAEGAGEDTKGRKKSDVNLVRLGAQPFPISLKKDSAEYWESADTLYGAQAETIVSSLESAGQLIYDRNKQKIFEDAAGKGFTGLAVNLTNAEKTNFVFGSDLLGSGIVVKGTYASATSPQFSFNKETGTLTVKASKIYQSLDDINRSDEEPFILIRKDSTRTAGLNKNKQYSGLRVLAAYKKRVSSGSVKMLNRNQFNI